jgi:uncharacterized protein (TIGR00299 family) protein
MRVAHFDCFSGISGDMTLGALVSIGVDSEAILEGIASLGLPVTVSFEQVRKGGFVAVQARVEAPPERKHRFLPEIEEILGRGKLTKPQRDLALRIFRRLAGAEAAVHGLPLERVHFHEVGALDSIADIAGAAIGIDLLGADCFTSRSVPTGSGMVNCEHGRMPIPAPATAELLRSVPLAASNIKAELTTPTGAAILTTIVNEWRDQPVMTVERIGHGAGRREFEEQPNLLRIFVGSAEDSAIADKVWVLETNLDDIPAELIGYCYEQLLAAGALDVYSTPIFMKKNRPGVLLSVLTTEAAMPALEEILFRETTTFGVRRYPVDRRVLKRKPMTVETAWGPIQGKIGWRAGHPPIFSPEYEDCARVAREHKVPLRDVYTAVLKMVGGMEDMPK